MGRPRIYETAEELEAAINEYFDGLSGEDGKESPPSMSGLARAIGFSSRQSLNDYEKDDRFSYLIKAARLDIETYWECRLAGTSPTGAIFWLKNHAGYKDAHEVTGKDGGPIGFRFVNPVGETSTGT